MSLFVVFKVITEDRTTYLTNNKDKFVGSWILVNNEANNVLDQLPDTTEEPDKYGIYETYEFLPNGTYYHTLNFVNSTGIWTVNNSILLLNESTSETAISYHYVFSDDENSVTFNLIDNLESFSEYERVNYS